MRYEGVSCVQVCVHRFFYYFVCAHKKRRVSLFLHLNVRVEIELWKFNSWLKAEKLS